MSHAGDHSFWKMYIEDVRKAVQDQREYVAGLEASIPEPGSVPREEHKEAFDAWTEADIELIYQESILEEIEAVAQGFDPEPGPDCDSSTQTCDASTTPEQDEAYNASVDEANELQIVDSDLDREVDASVPEPEYETQQQAVQAQADRAQHIQRAAQPPEEAEGEKKKIEDTEMWKEQCFLLSHIFQLVDYKRDKDEEPGAEPLQYRKWLPYLSHSDTNASLIVEGNPYKFLNQLTQYPSQAYLHHMEPHELSQLQPMIRLYKVREVDTDGNPYAKAKEELQEIHFSSNLGTLSETTSILKNSLVRGVGVGIQNFTFSYEADNIYAIKKAIKAKLTLFANSFDELLRDRGDYTYADLALKTGGKNLKNNVNPQQDQVAYENLDKLNFRLKAVIGWAYPQGKTVLSDGTKKAIEDSYISLNLTPTIHEFDIDDFGRVKFTINYLAYVEDYYDQSTFNIFNDWGASLRAMKRKLIIESMTEDCATADQLREKREEWVEEIKRDKEISLRTLVNNMMSYCNAETGENLSDIHLLEIPYTEITKFIQKGPYYEYGELQVDTTSASDQYVEDLLDDAAQARGPQCQGENSTSRACGGMGPLIDHPRPTPAPTGIEANTHIPFFYVSDMIDWILWSIGGNLSEGEWGMRPRIDDISEVTNQTIKDAEKNRLKRSEEQFKKLRIVLGPIEITDPRDPSKSKYVSLGDIPISLKYFIEWLTEKMLKRDKVVMTLTQFLSTFINELVRNFLNNDECFGGNIRQSTRLSQAAITSYKRAPRNEDDVAYDEITEAIKANQVVVDPNQSPAWYQTRLDTRLALPQPLLNVAGERDARPVPDGGGLAREINYLVYYAGRIMPAEKANGKRSEDESYGIFHYGIGSPKGIVKTIKFNKTSATGLKELRFEQQGYDGLQQLREMYDVEIKTYANVNAFPGVYIYVDPRSISPSIDFSQFPHLNDLTQLGVGGYHMIIRTEHSLGAGQAESTITAKWVAERYSGTDPEGRRSDRAGAKKCRPRGD